VTYRVEFQPSALRQLNGFPGGALDSRPTERQAVFGGVGLVTYEIDQARQVVAVTDVTWAG
jgi:hypothetical protein